MHTVIDSAIMQRTKSENLHRRNQDKETEALGLRNARARQSRLEEIGGKLDRAKHRSMRISNSQKTRILSELSSIHRVFEPIYLIKEGQERLAKNESAEENGVMQKTGSFESDATKAFAKQPRLLRRAQTQSITSSQTNQPNAEEDSQCPGEKIMILPDAKILVNDGKIGTLRQRSNSWSPHLPCSAPDSSRCAFQSKREYVAKLRTAVVEPRVSNSMSSLTLGYMAFKRNLNNKRRHERMARASGSMESRFRSMSLDETELTVIPELVEEIDASEKGTLPTPKRSISFKREAKQKIGFNRHRSVPNGQNQHLVSTFLWPSMKSSRVPREIIDVKNADLRKEDINGNFKGAEEGEIETTDEFLRQKVRFSQNRRISLRRASKLIKPLGTGCFSNSFQAVSQLKSGKPS